MSRGDRGYDEQKNERRIQSRRSGSEDSDDRRRSRRNDKKSKSSKKEYEEERYRKRRHRHRSFSNSSSSSPERRGKKKNVDKEKGEIDKYSSQKVVVNDIDKLGEDELMNQIMGFSSFSTTKGMNHKADSEEYISKSNRNKRNFRQYMNKKASTNRNERMEP